MTAAAAAGGAKKHARGARAAPVATRADCYSAGDRRFMAAWQRLREELLAPLLIALGRLRFTADAITVLGLVAGLAFCPLLFASPFAALVALGVHVVLDGLDGPLARFLGTASGRGSFTDTLADQVVIAATTAALAVHGSLAPVLAILYVFLYTLVVAFAMLRNALGVPYRWVLRPRFIVYAAIPLELWMWAGMLDGLVIALLVPLAWGAFAGARRVRKVL